MNNHHNANSSSTIFITGGSGYVGRNLIRHFRAQRMTVVALARSAAAAETVQALGAEVRRGDLHDDDLSRHMQGCGWLVHAAADTNHGWGGAAQRKTNVDGTRHVFDSARRAGIRRAVHLSTESVLLTGQPLVDVDETQPLPRRPVGGYSGTKAEAEQLALQSATDLFDVMVVRPRFVWGRDDTTALPQLTRAASSGQLAWIDGGGYPSSVTHIANLCHGVALALARGRSGHTYLLADAAPVVFRQFVTDLLATQGIGAPDKTVPRWLVRAAAAVGDALAALSSGRIALPINLQQYATMAVTVTLNTRKAQQELGYAPLIDLPAGMAELRQARHASQAPGAQGEAITSATARAGIR
jgi:nucleoside-diphosphate-sugar epimerase